MYTQRQVFKVMISVIRVTINVYLFTFNMLLKIAFVGNTWLQYKRNAYLLHGSISLWYFKEKSFEGKSEKKTNIGQNGHISLNSYSNLTN